MGTRFNDFVTGSKWVLFRNPDIKILAINTSEFHAEKLDATRCVGDAKVTLKAIMDKLKPTGYKSGYTDEIQKIREIWEKERLSVLDVQYNGEGFGEGKFVPCVPSWTKEIMEDYIRDIGGVITESNAVGIIREEIDDDAIVVAAAGSLPADLERTVGDRRQRFLPYGIRRFLYGIRDFRGVWRETGCAGQRGLCVGR